MILTVRVKNDAYDMRDRLAYLPPEYFDFTGTVMKNPSWVGEDSFCLSTGDPNWKFRIIEKDSIICGWKHN